MTDPVWNNLAARLVRKTGASALPVYFCGHNSMAFQLLGLINPRLRTLLLMQEFLQQQGKTLQVRVGSAVTWRAAASALRSTASIASDDEATEYLRLRTYLLSYRGKKGFSLPAKMRSAMPRKTQEAVAKAVPRELLARDIEALPSGRLLTENNELAVYAARAVPAR